MYSISLSASSDCPEDLSCLLVLSVCLCALFVCSVCLLASTTVSLVYLSACLSASTTVYLSVSPTLCLSACLSTQSALLLLIANKCVSRKYFIELITDALATATACGNRATSDLCRKGATH